MANLFTYFDGALPRLFTEMKNRSFLFWNDVSFVPVRVLHKDEKILGRKHIYLPHAQTANYDSKVKLFLKQGISHQLGRDAVVRFECENSAIDKQFKPSKAFTFELFTLCWLKHWFYVQYPFSFLWQPSTFWSLPPFCPRMPQLFDLNARIQQLTWSLFFYEKYSTSLLYLWFWPALILGVQ
jgi:hypothetical protein